MSSKLYGIIFNKTCQIFTSCTGVATQMGCPGFSPSSCSTDLLQDLVLPSLPWVSKWQCPAAEMNSLKSVGFSGNPSAFHLSCQAQRWLLASLQLGIGNQLQWWKYRCINTCVWQSSRFYIFLYGNIGDRNICSILQACWEQSSKEREEKDFWGMSAWKSRAVRRGRGRTQEGFSLIFTKLGFKAPEDDFHVNHSSQLLY